MRYRTQSLKVDIKIPRPHHRQKCNVFEKKMYNNEKNIISSRCVKFFKKTRSYSRNDEDDGKFLF